MINVNLFGGPGTGKSTTASGVFHTLKSMGYKVEYIQEYAKDLTFGEDNVKLSDQVHVLGEQHHRLHRLVGKVDIVIHDSPFVMGMSYVNKDLPYCNSFCDFTVELFNSYDNLNIFLARNTEEHGYQGYGRNQTLEEAIGKDYEIIDLLEDNKLNYERIVISQNTVHEIIALIKEVNGT